MEKRPLGRTGLSVSPVVFGGIVAMDEEQKDADRYVAYAVDRGVNYFDVAPSYGDAQIKLGNALRHDRSRVYLACKTEKRTAKDSLSDLQESLKALHTDHFDVYQLHAMTTQEDLDTVFSPGGAMETLVRAQREGFIRNIGFSAHNEDIALRALSLYDFDTVLFPVNWALGLGLNFGPRIAAACRGKQKGLLGMKTLAHRKWLEGEPRIYPKSWCKTIDRDERLGVAALKYTLSMGAAAVVPPGNFEQFSFAVEHIEECIAHPLDSADQDYLLAEIGRIDGQFIF